MLQDIPEGICSRKKYVYYRHIADLILRLEHVSEPPEGLLKQRLLGLTPRDSALDGAENLHFYLSPDDAHAGPVTTL